MRLLLMIFMFMYSNAMAQWAFWREYEFECDQPEIGCGKTHEEDKWDDSRDSIYPIKRITINESLKVRNALVDHFGAGKNKYMLRHHPDIAFAHFYYGPTTKYEMRIDVQGEGWMQRGKDTWKVLFTYPKNYHNPEDVNKLLDKHGIPRTWANYSLSRHYDYKRDYDAFNRYEKTHDLNRFRVYYCDQFSKTGECEAVRAMILRNVEYNCFNNTGDEDPYISVVLSELDGGNTISTSPDTDHLLYTKHLDEQ